MKHYAKLILQILSNIMLLTYAAPLEHHAKIRRKGFYVKEAFAGGLRRSFGSGMAFYMAQLPSCK